MGQASTWLEMYDSVPMVQVILVLMWTVRAASSLAFSPSSALIPSLLPSVVACLDRASADEAAMESGDDVRTEDSEGGRNEALLVAV